MAVGKITGTIESIDAAGNLITSLTAEQLAHVPRGEETAIVCDEHETRGIFASEAGQPEMTLLAVLGESGRLQITIVGDSAALMLGVRKGTPVAVTWS